MEHRLSRLVPPETHERVRVAEATYPGSVHLEMAYRDGARVWVDGVVLEYRLMHKKGTAEFTFECQGVYAGPDLLRWLARFRAWEGMEAMRTYHREALARKREKLKAKRAVQRADRALQHNLMLVPRSAA